MKKIALFTIFMFFLAGIVFSQYKNGWYYAGATAWENSGWRSFVVLEVKGGKISSVNWNGTNNLAVADKKTWSSTGRYGMERTAKQGAWHVQAKRIEDFLLAQQQVAAFKINAQNKTDAVSGASIAIGDFVQLVGQALTKPAITKGIYRKDGVFVASGAQDSGGWTDHVLAVVVNGTLVDVVWNATYKDASRKSKLQESITDKYVMTNASKGQWHAQASAVQNYLLQVQDPAKVLVNKSNKVDAISSASITSGNFFQTAIKALESAR
jgi:major membrane immunogen (membrane-anchored lipoprotein)